MTLKQSYLDTRQRFVQISKSLEVEDYSVQPEIFVSPPKWHLAHSTWFFEQFVLVANNIDYKVFDDDFAYLFNSYYNNAGDRVLRPNRGLMTRPSVQEVFDYRDYVDQAMMELFDDELEAEVKEVIMLGIQHEQQHQELFYYDIKYILGHQPTFPTIQHNLKLSETKTPVKWLSINEGLYEIGHEGRGFCYDNELARHKVFLESFQIADQLVTNREYLEFITDGGYKNFNFWHAEGWDYIQNNNLAAPLYWHYDKGSWKYYTLNGFQEIVLDEPVSQISYYEAYAYAEWKGMRLPTEFEWEAAAPLFDYGQLWEWTNSAYLPYPRFAKAPGALGEYNGKFMINQMVLRGASYATVPGHSRLTYRNFFHSEMRWQFSGIRLVK